MAEASLTNIERCFVEVRCHTRSAVCFISVQPLDRSIYCIFQRFNLERMTHILGAFTQAA
jgi:hypothetical protein